MNNKNNKKEKKLQKKFEQLAQESEPKPKLAKNCIMAFIVGGIICVIGEFFGKIILEFTVLFYEVIV